MILVTRLRSHGKHSIAHANNSKEMLSQTAIETILIAAILRTGLASA